METDCNMGSHSLDARRGRRIGRQTVEMGRTGWLLAWAEWMLGWMIWGTGDGGLDGDWMDDDWKGECQIDL